jgi:hypothetical protein
MKSAKVILSWIANLIERTVSHVCQTVPEEIAICEFDCDHQNDCFMKDRNECERRGFLSLPLD